MQQADALIISHSACRRVPCLWAALSSCCDHRLGLARRRSEFLVKAENNRCMLAVSGSEHHYSLSVGSAEGLSSAFGILTSHPTVVRCTATLDDHKLGWYNKNSIACADTKCDRGRLQTGTLHDYVSITPLKLLCFGDIGRISRSVFQFRF